MDLPCPVDGPGDGEGSAGVNGGGPIPARHASDALATTSADLISTLLRLGSRVAGCPLYLLPPYPVQEQPAAGGLPGVWCSERLVESPLGAVGTLRAVDIHDRRELEPVRRSVLDDVARLLAGTHHLSSLLGRTEPLTGLPNRRQFLDDFAAQGAAAHGMALVMVALAEPARYAAVVRALGHDYAEGIVRAGTGILIDHLPAGSVLYQVSPLGFVFLADVSGRGLSALADGLVRAFQRPIVYCGIPIDTHVGIGVVTLDDGSDGAEALRAAMAAAQDSRGTRSGWAIYDRGADAAHRKAFSLLADLRHALEGGGGLSLHFQPRIDFASGACVGAEALIRWTHPERGAVPPAEFIPLAEATALISPLTDWVIDAAAAHAATLSTLGFDLPVSVNVSPKNLAEPDFVEKLERVLDRRRLPPQRLELEFTEGTLASDQRLVRHHLDRINAMGVEIAIDDFGSGYSNMSYLTQIPAGILKIDQAFVRPMMESEKNRHLVKAIIGMGRGLGYRVVAEGVETADAFATLASWSCDEAQGYFISRPLPARDLAEWLQANRDGFTASA